MRHGRHPIIARAVGLVALGLLAPQIASASNGAGQRTPPIYPLAACIAEVDRSLHPVFHPLAEPTLRPGGAWRT
ncbi:MAG: hypothetical protein ACRBN8_02310 [Nannocystales bacterium]